MSKLQPYKVAYYVSMGEALEIPHNYYNYFYVNIVNFEDVQSCTVMMVHSLLGLAGGSTHL